MGSLNRQRRNLIAPPVYVFTAGEPGHFGLTLLRDGGNLPPGEARRWTLFLQVTMADDDLFPFTEHINTARTQLSLHSFYLTQNSATILPFPKAHRSSA
jgi:hypothetical protein